MRVTVLVSVCALAMVGTMARGAELLVNGGFESQPNFGSGTVGNDPGYSAFTGAQIPGWTIEPGHAVTIHNTLRYPTITGFSLNTDGEGFNGNNADLYQDFIADPSQPLVLTFQHVGWINTGVTATVTATDLESSAVLYSKTFGWTTEVVTETAGFTGRTIRIRIASTNNSGAATNDNTLILDNFSVQSIPEPGLMGVLPVVAGLMVRRKRRS